MSVIVKTGTGSVTVRPDVTDPAGEKYIVVQIKNSYTGHDEIESLTKKQAGEIAAELAEFAGGTYTAPEPKPREFKVGTIVKTARPGKGGTTTYVKISDDGEWQAVYGNGMTALRPEWDHFIQLDLATGYFEIVYEP